MWTRNLLDESSPYKLIKANGYWEKYFKNLPTPMQRIIDDKIMDHIRWTPYNTEQLGEELTGLWSYNKLESGYRIGYAVCEHCRKKGFTKVNNCKDCASVYDEYGDKTIKLFFCGPHPIYEDFKRKNGKRRRKALQKRRKR